MAWACTDDNCIGSCAGSCGGVCGNTCTGDCGGTCSGSCGNGCSGGCLTTCTGSCKNACSYVCGNECFNVCGNSCGVGCNSGCIAVCGNNCINNANKTVQNITKVSLVTPLITGTNIQSLIDKSAEILEISRNQSQTALIIAQNNSNYQSFNKIYQEKNTANSANGYLVGQNTVGSPGSGRRTLGFTFTTDSYGATGWQVIFYIERNSWAGGSDEVYHLLHCNIVQGDTNYQNNYAGKPIEEGPIVSWPESVSGNVRCRTSIQRQTLESDTEYYLCINPSSAITAGIYNIWGVYLRLIRAGGELTSANTYSLNDNNLINQAPFNVIKNNLAEMGETITVSANIPTEEMGETIVTTINNKIDNLNLT